MKKNIAGQSIGAQLINAGSGAAFTGSVTVSVTGDAGTQATGSVGSGACTHEGNGYHTYAPAQAETNYDLIAFTFTGTNAIPSTVQVYTDFSADVLKLNGDATSAANVAKTTRAIVRCTVGSASTTTSIVTSACSPAGAVADQFKGRVITFDADTATAALRGQATDITASSNSATPTFTVTALTTAPSSGDLFSIT